MQAIAQNKSAMNSVALQLVDNLGAYAKTIEDIFNGYNQKIFKPSGTCADPIYLSLSWLAYCVNCLVTLREFRRGHLREAACAKQPVVGDAVLE